MVRRFSFVWFIALLVLLTGVAILTPYLYNRSQLLEPEELAEAVRRWQANGLADYDLNWEEKTRERGEQSQARYKVKVRDGKLTDLILDGNPVEVTRLRPDRRDSFTVPGLLKQMGDELEEERRNEGRRNYINAFFDPRTGCPFRYVRRHRDTSYRLERTIKLIPVASK